MPLPDTHRLCERAGCDTYFDIRDHQYQRFCSKSCAKKGTRNRHNGLLNELGKDALELALLLVATGISFGKASELTGVTKSTIHNHYQKTKG